ncbi:MAG: glycosyltransferase family 2 protein [Aquabacterium sp.]|uniref:glycosyltransferase family 2 protein n=1 Tax=Aquabacterium sp. TaxID=1872578 RepID=UPI003BD8A398
MSSNQTDPQISVVIPTFNRKDKVLAAIKSVLDQTLQPLEIIVVDDLSTDGTAEIDWGAISPLIRYVPLTVKAGGGGARNEGIKQAQGQWVAFLDSDDLWLPNKLKEQVEFLNASPESIDVLSSNVYWRNGRHADVVFNTKVRRPNEHISHYLMVRDGAYQTSGLLIRRDVLLQVPFDPTLRKHQDWDLVFRLEAAGFKLAYSDMPLAIYVAEADPLRISIGVSDVSVSVDWMRRRSSVISPESAAYYFSYRLFSRAVRSKGVAAIPMWWSFAVRSHRSFLYATAGICASITGKMNRVFQSS